MSEEGKEALPAAPTEERTEERQLTRREAGIVLAIALAAGGAFFVAGRLSAAPLPDAAQPARAARPAAPVRPTAPAPTASEADGVMVPPLNGFPEVSFAQQGEDLIIKEMFAELEIRDATYLDIGAHDPIRGNNTFLFYALGSKGVLVEPNPVYVEKLKRVRPRDVVIDKGVGIAAEKSAKYYEFNGDGQLNTFSPEQVKKLDAVGVKPVKVVDMELVDVNDILAQNFPKEPPSLLSVDTEGLDLAILQKLDFTRFRPAIICAETEEVASSKALPEITTFLATKHYTARGGTFVNTIYIADELVAKMKPEDKTGIPPPKTDAGK